MGDQFVFAGIIGAVAVQDQGMMDNVKVQHLTYCILYILYPGVAKFLDLVAFGTDQVIVLSVAIGLFILCQVLAKLVLDDQMAFY